MKFGTWLGAWVVMVMLNMGFAYAIMQLEGASMARSMVQP
jgi:hypothetical protein